jgi:hypothetical protein
VYSGIAGALLLLLLAIGMPFFSANDNEPSSNSQPSATHFADVAGGQASSKVGGDGVGYFAKGYPYYQRRYKGR